MQPTNFEFVTNVRTTEAPPNPTVRDLLTKVLLVRFQSPSCLHSRFERHLPMPDWPRRGHDIRVCLESKNCRQPISQEEVAYEIHLGEREKSPSREFVLVVLRADRRKLPARAHHASLIL